MKNEDTMEKNMKFTALNSKSISPGQFQCATFFENIRKF